MYKMTEVPLRLQLHTAEYLEQFKYTEFDRETLLDSGAICTNISDYPQESILVSNIEPSKEILSLHLAFCYALENKVEDLCTIIRLTSNRDQEMETTTFPRGEKLLIWETKLALIENKVVYIKVKVG